MIHMYNAHMNNAYEYLLKRKWLYMSKELRNVSAEVSKEVWKKLKIISIQKEMTLPKVIEDILCRVVNKKSETIIEENV